jgi:hypothetical protein
MLKELAARAGINIKIIRKHKGFRSMYGGGLYFTDVYA